MEAASSHLSNGTAWPTHPQGEYHCISCMRWARREVSSSNPLSESEHLGRAVVEPKLFKPTSTLRSCSTLFACSTVSFHSDPNSVFRPSQKCVDAGRSVSKWIKVH